MVIQGEKSNSVQLQAGGKHLISDGYTTVGLLVGLGLIWVSGWLFLDNVVAIFLGGYICFAGYRIIRKSIAGIMDEADSDIVQKIAKILQKGRRPQWVDVHNLKVVQYGPRIHVDIHVTLPWYFSLQEAHDEMNAIELLVATKLKSAVEFSIHAEPCISQSCKVCRVQNCVHRKSNFMKEISWNTAYVLSDQHHGVEN